MITHPRFVITFTSAPGVAGIRSLRLLLKAAPRELQDDRSHGRSSAAR